MQISPAVIGGKLCLAIRRQDGIARHVKLKNHFWSVVWRKVKTWITLIL